MSSKKTFLAPQGSVRYSLSLTLLHLLHLAPIPAVGFSCFILLRYLPDLLTRQNACFGCVQTHSAWRLMSKGCQQPLSIEKAPNVIILCGKSFLRHTENQNYSQQSMEEI